MSSVNQKCIFIYGFKPASLHFDRELTCVYLAAFCDHQQYPWPRQLR